MATTRSRPWVKNKRLDNVLRGSPLTPSAAAADRYYAALRKLILKMTEITERDIKRLYNQPHAREYFAEDESTASQARIMMAKLREKIDALFSGMAKELSERMTDDMADNSAASLKTSLTKIMPDLTLNTDILTGELSDIVKASVAENVSLIRSIPQRYLQSVEGAVMRSITTGRGLADLIPDLRDQFGVTTRRARFIAEDQTRKVYNSISRGRMERLGVTHFEWLHSGGGQHPRPDHVAMSGNIYSISEPPVIDKKTGERGFPGQLPRCRCKFLPVVKFDEE